MTPFPLSPVAETAPVPSANRRPAPVSNEDKFVVTPVEPVSRDLPAKRENERTEHPVAAPVQAGEVPLAPETVAGPVTATVADKPQTNAESTIRIPELFESLTATTNKPAMAPPTSDENIASVLVSGNISAKTPNPAPVAGGNPATGEGADPTINPGSPAVSSLVQESKAVGSATANPAAQVAGGVIPSTVIPGATVQTARPAALRPAPSGQASTGNDAGNIDGETGASRIAAATDTKSTNPGPFKTESNGTAAPTNTDAANASLRNNTALLAQSFANAPQADPGESVRMPVAPGSSPLLETPTVTQNFNTELRAAIDAPTQAAAYTAKGAVTAQPAAEQIALQISRAAAQGTDKLTVHLKPAELGKITIDLEVGPDNRLIAVIAADKSETLDLLQRDARQLERALNEAGLKTDSGSLEFNLRGEGGQADDGTDTDGKLLNGAIMLPGDELDDADGGPQARTPLIVPEGRIDIQV